MCVSPVILSPPPTPPQTLGALEEGSGDIRREHHGWKGTWGPGVGGLCPCRGWEHCGGWGRDTVSMACRVTGDMGGSGGGAKVDLTLPPARPAPGTPGEATTLVCPTTTTGPHACLPPQDTPEPGVSPVCVVPPPPSPRGPALTGHGPGGGHRGAWGHGRDPPAPVAPPAPRGPPPPCSWAPPGGAALPAAAPGARPPFGCGRTRSAPFGSARPPFGSGAVARGLHARARRSPALLMHM